MSTATNMTATRPTATPSVNLMEAHNEWARRPADERFESLEALLAAMTTSRARAVAAPMPRASLRVVNNGESLLLAGAESDKVATLTNWSFGQLCKRAGAPASYMAKLPADEAARCLNIGLANDLYEGDEIDPDDAQTPEDGEGDEDTELLLLDTSNDKLKLRCLTSTKYRRVWNNDLVQPLMGFGERGWRVPPARPAMENQPGTRRATEEDVLRCRGKYGLSVRVGDEIAPAGLYASDRDMFVFMVNEDTPIALNGRTFYRGFFLSNTEEGRSSVSVTLFLYESVCGNHIVWGATGVQNIRLPHVGQAPAKALNAVRSPLLQYATRAASEDEALLRNAANKLLGDDKEDVLDVLGRRRSLKLSRTFLSNAFDACESTYDEHGNDPRSVMGIVEGITRASQKKQNADSRNAIDRAAGDVMRIVF